MDALVERRVPGLDAITSRPVLLLVGRNAQPVCR
jgi:hypothetical protein